MISSSEFGQSSCSVALAPAAGLAFFYRRDGRFGLVDVLQGKVLEHDLSIECVPVRIVVDAHAHSMALLDNAGQGMRLRLLPDSSGVPVGFEPVGYFEYRVPRHEAPVAEFVGDALWFQQRDGSLAVIGESGLIESPPLAVDNWDGCGELSAVVAGEEHVVLAARYRWGTRLWAITGAGRLASMSLNSLGILCIATAGELLALALTDCTISVYRLSEAITQLWQVELPDSSQDELAESSEFPSAMVFRAGELWFVSETGALHTISRNEPHDVRAVSVGDLRFSGAKEIATPSDDCLLLLTPSHAYQLRGGPSTADLGVPLLCVYDAADGGDGYYALCERDDGVHLIDGVSQSVCNFIGGKRSTYLTAIDDDYHMLVSSFPGRASWIDLDCRMAAEVKNAPERVVSIAGRQGEGFWLADSLGQIFSVDTNYRCALAGQLDFTSIVGLSLCSCGDRLAATGGCLDMHASGDTFYFLACLRVAGNSSSQLQISGRRLFAPRDGKLMLQGIVRGAFRCGDCGVYTCFECSHGTTPCRCGSLSWGEVIYREGSKRSWWSRAFGQRTRG